jgi:hypothetical protein
MSFSIPTLRAYRIITGGAGYDYSAYCAALNSGTAGCPYWGADVLLNGGSYTCGANPNISGESVTVTYTISSTLQQFLSDNPDVTITYQNHMECENPPANVYDSAVTSFTNGATAVLTRNCSSGPALVTITLLLSSPTNRELFYDTCCVPYAVNCGSITSLQVSIYFNLDP